MDIENLRPIAYVARRQHFLGQLAAEGRDSVAVVPAHPELLRNHDVPFKFRQDSNFRYLTGFDEPDAIAVFRNVGGKKEFILFVRPKDLEKEIWTGYRCGVEAAVSRYGADRAFPVAELEAQLPKLLAGAERVYYSFHKTLHMNGVEYLDAKMLRLLDAYRASQGRSGRGMLPVHDVTELVAEMRVFKAPDEIERLRAACAISAKAHLEAIARARPGLYEYQLEALIEYVFLNEGAARHGYPSIVAGGANATILHYVENSAKLRDGDLLLIDAGAELDYYTGDITRTFAINGTMTPAQLEIYEIVLAVQKECIRMARPGATIAAIHQFAAEELADAMVRLKWLPSGDKKKIVEAAAHRRYYPHGTGHFLGMDVHDIGFYQEKGEPRKLEPGMVFTIEPGLYVLRDDSQAPAKYRGIGVRIEDDVVITADGCEVLTSGAPKEVDDLSGLAGSKPWLAL